jgi:hypothetical protein
MIPDRFDVPARFPAQYIPPPPPPPPPPRPSDDQLRQLAKDVKKTGDRSWQTDHYEARMDRFAQVMEPLDRESRARLMGFMLHEDSGALNSWLRLDRLDSRVAGGQVTAAQRTAVTDAIAAAYESGPQRLSIDHLDDLLVFPDSGADYNAILSRVDAFAAHLPPAERERFVSQYSQDLITREIDLQQNHFIRGSMPSLGSLGVHQLSQTAQGRADLAAYYVGLNAEDRETLRTMLARDGEMYLGTGDDPALNNGPSDSFSLLVSALAEQPGQGQPIYVPSTNYVSGHHGRSPYDDASVELVRWADQHHEHFFAGDKAMDQRAEAMADLFLNHDDAILHDLTDPRLGQQVEDKGSSGYEPLALDDVLALGNLNRMTLLNPDVSSWKAGVMQREMTDYVGANYADADGRDAEGNSTLGRVGMVMLSMQDGVKQGYKALEDNRAAQERFVGFFTDLIVDGTSGAVTKAGPQGVVTKLVAGAGIDAATDAGKELAREKATDLLFGSYDTSNQDAVQHNINELVGDYLTSRPQGDRALQIGTFMEARGEAIDGKRSG